MELHYRKLSDLERTNNFIITSYNNRYLLARYHNSPRCCIIKYTCNGISYDISHYDCYATIKEATQAFLNLSFKTGELS